jgi:hypothetical protein
MPGKRKPPAPKPRRPPRRSTSLLLRAIDPAALAAQQGVKPIANPQELFADFWPADETADQVVDAVRRWRREGNAGNLS